MGTNVFIWAVAASIVGADDSVTGKVQLSPQLHAYLEARSREYDQIAGDRKAKLQSLAQHLQKQRQANGTHRLTFICTHNSRRSQMSQVWAAAAARFYGIEKVEAYSGGTEVTAFNPRAVSALQRAGVDIRKTSEAKNPQYEVRFLDAEQPMVCFSKIYDEAPNPKQAFCAVMTCSQADNRCPVVTGCSFRLALPFEDPKVSDNLPVEQATYDERCQDICRELMFLFSQMKSATTAP